MTGLSLLVVDEEARVRQIVGNILSSFGVSDVDGVESLQSAHVAVASRTYTIILCAQALADGSGPSFAKALVSGSERPFFILMTDAAPNERTATIGIDAVLDKPFTVRAMFDVLLKRTFHLPTLRRGEEEEEEDDPCCCDPA